MTANHDVKFVNGTAVMGLISGGDQLAQAGGGRRRWQWCMDNQPLPNRPENQGGHSGEGAHL